jgi:uncharacterized protein (DUF1015 family)
MTPDQAGFLLAPFRGVRYAADRVTGLAQVTSPPYDVIALDKEDQLMALDPHNVVRLILPGHLAAHQGAEYQHAALALQQWRAQGILVPDPVPALYVYEQVPCGEDGEPPPGAPVQRGLIGALRLSPLEAGIVLPHEDIAPAPVADRRMLMEATQANLEPIFLLYDGFGPPPAPDSHGSPPPAGSSGLSTSSAPLDSRAASASPDLTDPSAAPASSVPAGATARIIAEVAQRPPLMQVLIPGGLRHRLWAITDSGRLDAIAADLAQRRALIADGHHRYAAYLDLQARRHDAGDGPGPWDFGLALVVDAAAYPPWIAAIHRVVPEPGPAEAARLAAAAFRVRKLPGGSSGLPGALDQLAAGSAAGPAFLLAGGEAAYLLTDPDPAQVSAVMPVGRSARWRALPAAILQELLMRKLWGIRAEQDSVQVVHHDAAAALRAADELPGGTAVICCPMSASEVYSLAAEGERVPRKSTSFRPKPRTGLVMRLFADS